MFLYDAVGFVASAFIMVKASSYSVKYVSRIAKTDRISPFLTSFLLIGIVSSFPETFVMLISSLNGLPSLGLGTLLGGNIADLSLVLGIVGVAAGRIQIHSREFAHDFWLVGLVMMPILFSLDGSITRVEGCALVLACFMFVFSMLREDHVFSKLTQHPQGKALHNIALFFGSCAVALFAANFVFKFAQVIGADLGIPLALVGVIFIAVVSTLPELMFSLASLKSNIDGLALGDVFGTVIIDATLMVGGAAILSPITIVGLNIINVAVFSALAVSATLFFLKPGKVFTRNQGVLLILLYIIFVATEFATTLR